jgi:hypothetical protein
MKTIGLGLCMVMLCFDNTNGQSNNTTEQVIEGGKVVVELIKALSGKKDPEKNADCKGRYADLCVVNESSSTIRVELNHQLSKEKREIVIQPSSKECCLQISIGVWTYDLHDTERTESIRKGDLLIEGCQNLLMNIKY